MLLRHYRPADAEAVARLWYESWTAAFPGVEHPLPYARWRERVERELPQIGAIWVAEAQRGIVGFMVLAVGIVNGQRRGYIDQLFVAPERQRQGIGSALLALATSEAPGGLVLQTLIQNAGARAFYERHGLVAGRVSTNGVNGLPNVEYRWRPAAPGRGSHADVDPPNRPGGAIREAEPPDDAPAIKPGAPL